MLRLKSIFALLVILVLSSCNNHSNLYEITDKFVESLSIEYESYGVLGGMDHITFTKDRKYQVFPSGRLINVKIMEVASDEDYEDLREDLESHYKNDHRVNRVYRCNAGTLMIDCRN